MSSSGDEAGSHQPAHVVEVQGVVQRFFWGDCPLLMYARIREAHLLCVTGVYSRKPDQEGSGVELSDQHVYQMTQVILTQVDYWPTEETGVK